MDSSSEELGRAGTKQDVFAFCDGIPNLGVQLPEESLKLFGQGGLVTEGVAHPVPPRHHNCTALRMLLPEWLQEQWISPATKQKNNNQSTELRNFSKER